MSGKHKAFVRIHQNLILTEAQCLEIGMKGTINIG